MSKITFISDMIKNAGDFGYTPQANEDKVLLYKCGQCQKKKMVVFVNQDGRKIRACTCGYRASFGAKTSYKEDKEPNRCKAITKKGDRCKKPADGHGGLCKLHTRLSE